MRLPIDLLKNTISKGVLFTYASVGVSMVTFLLVQPILFKHLSEDYIKFIYISFIQAFVSVFEMPFATMLTADNLGKNEKGVYGLSLQIFGLLGVLVFLLQVIFKTQDIYFILLVSTVVTVRANSNILRGYNNSKLKFKLNFKIGLTGAILRNFISVIFLILTGSFNVFWTVYTISFLIENFIYRSSSNLSFTAILINSGSHYPYLKKRLLSLGVIAVLGLVTTQVERYILLNRVIESDKPISTLYYQYLSALIALLMPIGQLYLAFTKETMVIDHQNLTLILKKITILFISVSTLLCFAYIDQIKYCEIAILMLSIVFNVFWYYIIVKHSNNLLNVLPFVLSIVVLLTVYRGMKDGIQFMRILMLSNLAANLGYVIVAHLKLTRRKL